MKETFRTRVFETNSSTMHTLSFSKEDNEERGIIHANMPDVKDIKVIEPMMPEEYYNKYHCGVKNKLRMLLTNIIVETMWDNREEYVGMIKKIVENINLKYGSKIVVKADPEELKRKSFFKEWNFIDSDRGLFFEYEYVAYTAENLDSTQLEERMSATERFKYCCLGQFHYDKVQREEYEMISHKFELEDTQDLYELILDNNITFNVIGR